MDYITRPLSRKNIRQFAFVFREIFDVPQDTPFPVLHVLESIPDVFGGSVVSVVKNNELPMNIPARCTPLANGGFLIEIKQSVYEGAYYRNIGAYLNHICHEMCHVFLFTLGYIPIYERSFHNRQIRACESVEWQAKALCGEVMIPYKATLYLTAKEIAEKYHVSLVSAQYRKRY